MSAPTNMRYEKAEFRAWAKMEIRRPSTSGKLHVTAAPVARPATRESPAKVSVAVAVPGGTDVVGELCARLDAVGAEPVWDEPHAATNTADTRATATRCTCLNDVDPASGRDQVLGPQSPGSTWAAAPSVRRTTDPPPPTVQ